ncbi:hypothetical protein J4474_04775 [Candidatus Pacearchaeota archaeon]|nr:hypothetical protein [Candidatus Pacearchaeota archaeon]
MDTTKILELTSSCRYGQFNLLESPPEVLHYNYDNSIKLTRFYPSRLASPKGTCFELSCFAQNKLVNLFPENDFYILNGHDPNFFFPESSNHFFILGFEDKISDEEKSELSSPRFLQKKNPLIIDPSFNFVGRFNDSEYNASSPRENVSYSFFSTTLNLANGSAVPIVHSRENNLLLYLVNQQGRIMVGFQTPKKWPSFFNPNSDKVRQHVPKNKTCDAFLDLVNRLSTSY